MLFPDTCHLRKRSVCVTMAYREQLFDRWGNPVRSPNKRSRRQDHEVSDSDYDGDQGTDYEDAAADRYRDPSAYLKAWKGYDSDDDDAEFSDDPERFEDVDEVEDSDSSEDDEDDKSRKKLAKSVKDARKKTASKGFDFSTLPAIHNNGLKYLPKMRYFPVGEVCPVKPQNKVTGESLTVLVQSENGAFYCIAIPFEAVEEFENEYVYIIHSDIRKIRFDMIGIFT